MDCIRKGLSRRLRCSLLLNSSPRCNLPCCQSTTLHTELHTSPNISEALLCILTHCIVDSADCATTIPPPASVPPHMPCLVVCLFVYLCHQHMCCLLCLFVSDIDRQWANAKSNCTCCIRRGLGRRLRSSLLLNLSPRCDLPCRVVYLTHHHVVTQRPSHPAHVANPGTTEPTKCPDYITTCGPTSTTYHNQTSKDCCPHSIHRSAR